MQNEIQSTQIESKIIVLRGKQVMIDHDLAELYGVETKVLNQAVKRHLNRFPERFMFQLSEDEFAFLRSQNVTSKTQTRGGRQYS
ncbi:MAG: ORF6N domain-containing protein, partial [Spirochaetales bacterium]|nr:ORF6N domain-containing protein [Spirochaetales bacterium]